MVAQRKTIAVDFDGVLHSYGSGWQGFDQIPDPPNEGAIHWLRTLIADGRFDVCIHSSRSHKPEGVAAMMAWLMRNGLTRTHMEQVEFPTKKPPATVSLDDRAIQFNGHWPSLEELADFKPWYQRPGTAEPSAEQQRGRATYGDAESLGEAKALWSEEHICNRCIHCKVCELAQAADRQELLAAISRCGGYIDAPWEEETDLDPG